MNAASEKRLKLLMPAFAVKVRQIVDNLAKQGFTIEITQGYRTFAEQDALYAQGRTRKGPKVTWAKGGQSLHNYAVAADFALMSGGKYTWPDPHPVWEAIAREAKRLGLESGYYWKKQDKPHVEIPDVDWKTLRKWYNQGGLAKVWDSVEL